jgi:cell division protein ZapE
MTQTTATQDLGVLYEHELRVHGYRSDPAQQAALSELIQLRARLIARQERAGARGLIARLRQRTRKHADDDAIRGVYLVGPVGRGKTWLMDLFVRSLPFPQVRRRHFYRFMEDVHAALKACAGSADPLDRVAADIARDTLVLCFDELQVHDIADAMILGTLFEALFRHGVTLVATSNTLPDALYRDGLQRARFLPAIALLKQNLLVVHVDGGADYRLRNLRRAGTWLDAADRTGSDAGLARLFEDLAQDDSANARHHITIAERNIATAGVSREAVWFKFSDLCEGPRSAADYIEIARRWPTVIVAQVPVFTSLSDDAARRFIALVDELYDHDVKLVVSACADPLHLYRGERLAAQFERTVSRLTEMQTLEYLGRPHRP